MYICIFSSSIYLQVSNAQSIGYIKFVDQTHNDPVFMSRDIFGKTPFTYKIGQPKLSIKVYMMTKNVGGKPEYFHKSQGCLRL